MRTFWTVIAIIIAALVLILAVLLFVFRPSATGQNEGNQSETSSSTFTTSGSGTSNGSGTPPQNQMTISARGTGNPISVNDFVDNGVTLADPQNKGNYYLAGGPGYCLKDGTCPSGAKADDFIITYDAGQQIFDIGLTKEPLGQARLDAEQFLLNTLGVTQSTLCDINYYLSTTAYVNSQYAGTNLGFSFCPDATPLP